MSENNLPNKILVIDDDPSVPQSLVEPLGRYNVKVDKASDLDSALYLFNQNRYDVVLIEMEFEPIQGLALVQKWRAHEVVDKRTTSFIMMTGNKANTGQNDGLVKELGHLDIIAKPLNTVHLLSYLSRAVSTRKRQIAIAEMKNKIEGYYTKTGNFEKAVEEVKRRLPELGSEGIKMLCDLYEKGGKLEDALSLLTPLSERDPGNIALLNARGRILLRMGNLKEAKIHMEKADLAAPKNIDRINEMAQMYISLNDGDRAVAKFKELVELNPDCPDDKFHMFSRLFEGGLDSHAIEFGKETAKPMEIVRFYNNKGVMMSKQEDRIGALNEYDRALKFYPQFKENYRILYNIALANIAMKTAEGYQEAHQNLKECLKLSPNFEKALKTIDSLEKVLSKISKTAS